MNEKATPEKKFKSFFELGLIFIAFLGDSNDSKFEMQRIR